MQPLKSWNRQQQAERRILTPPELRGSSHARGYDGDWTALRNQYITEHPLCEHCAMRDLTVPAEEVDHIRPFHGPADPLRLDASNLQSLCHACHVTKTWADRKEGDG